MNEIVLSQSEKHTIKAKIRHEFEGLTSLEASSSAFRVDPIILSSGKTIAISANLVSFNLQFLSKE